MIGLRSNNPGAGDALQSIDKIIESSADIVDVQVYDTRNDNGGDAWRFGVSGNSLGTPPRVMDIYSEGGATDTVTVVDVTQPLTPVFKTWNVTNPGNISALNGLILISTTVGVVGIELNYKDEVWLWDATGKQIADQTPATFDMATVTWGTASGDPIVNNTVNDVAITALSGAETDPATGLPYPTIGLATDGGVSVINHDGSLANVDTVHDSANTATFSSVCFRASDGHIFGVRDDINRVLYFSAYSTDSFGLSIQYLATSVPAVNNTPDRVACNGTLFVGGPGGVNIIEQDDASSTDGMVAYITKDYNTGWMQGDIELAISDSLTDRSVTGTVVTDNGVAVIAAIDTGNDQQMITASGGTITAPVTTGGAIYGWEKVGGTWFFRANTGWVGVSETAGTLTVADGTTFAMLRYTNGSGPSAAQYTVIEADEAGIFTTGAKCFLAGTSNAVADLSYDAGSSKTDVATGDGNSVFGGATSILTRTDYLDSGNSPLTSDTMVAVSRVNDQLAMASSAEATMEVSSLGEVAIEYSNSGDYSSRVATKGDGAPLDLKPLNYSDDNSFSLITGTTTTASTSSPAPVGATHATITGVSGNHYIRVDGTPTTSTGGKVLISGTSRVVEITPGQTISAVLTS